MESYLQRFSELVPEEWTSRAELAKLVSGHVLAVMFGDTSIEEALLTAAGPAPREGVENHLLYAEHLKLSLTLGQYYAVATGPSQIMDGSVGTSYLIFQLVDTKPYNKKYVERSMGWAEDLWHGRVGVVVLGTPETTIDLDEDEVGGGKLLPLDQSFHFTASTGHVQQLPLQFFFKHNFDNIYCLTV